MARNQRNSKFETRTSRLKWQPRGKPYTACSLGRGIKLLYRRTRTGNGSWVAKVANGHGGHWTDAFAQADDFDEKDGKSVLDFYQAQTAAKKLARGDTSVASAAPITVEQALDSFKTDLKARNANPYNARMPRPHLPPALLGKPVMLLTKGELESWRNGLLDRVKTQTANRIAKALRAALELAASHDRDRVKNAQAWRDGLSGLPVDEEQARNVVLSDAEVSAFVAACYRRDAALGLLADVLSVTGARPSQAVRLRVEDLVDDPKAPTLNMPKSGKGGGRNRSERRFRRYSVPITAQLAVKLKQAAVGRDGDAPLLVKSDGSAWSDTPSHDYRDDVAEIVKALKLDPDATMYALRHSHIVRALLHNVPVRLVAASVDSSISMIEKHYSLHISKYGDEHLRKALRHHDETPVADNVVTLVR
jgi:integrase